MKHNLCILVVEDDPVLGPMAFQTLAHLGHRSKLATTAPAAARYLRQSTDFQVVLLDLQLGNERSEGFIAQLRDEGADLPPIVIFSALPFPELQHASRTIGAHSIVQKPASVDSIHRAIQAAVA